MSNLQPQNLRMRIVPGADWRKIRLSYWPQANPQRCLICHPSPYPPFPDCPHGHYLNPWRLEQQLRYHWQRDFVWYTAIWLLSGLFLAGGPFVFAISTVCYLFFFSVFMLQRAMLRSMAKRLYRQNVGYLDTESTMWEKCHKHNEPWVKRYFP